MRSPATVATSPDQVNRDNGVWLTALGIVYGDLGTSPLYTLQTVSQALGGQFTPGSALGVLSLIYRNAVKVVDRFQLPARNVVEIARKIEV